MKNQLIHIALGTTAAVLLSSCDEYGSSHPGDAAVSANQAGSEIQTTEDTPAHPDITAEDIKAAFAPRIAPQNYLSIESVDFECTPKANGDLQVKAHVGLRITEDLYNRVEAPAEFAVARKEVLALYQSAEKPDSSYLLDMGAETHVLTEEDRKVKPLPENLLNLYNELVNLSESYCYKPDRTAGTTFSVELTMDAHWDKDKWNIINIVETEDLLSPLSFLTTASGLAADASVLTQEFIATRMAEIAAKADAFKTEAEAYHKMRDEAARALLTIRMAHLQEAALKAAEEARKAAAEAAAKQEWSNFCIKHFSAGSKFLGEWTRDARFGELTIQVDEATLHENALLFYGIMFDTKLPQASIKISGRCSLVREEDGSSEVNITLYTGRYDPDEPTAEVYDAEDGRLILNFDKNGKLHGVMTCASWVETPKKNFAVDFKSLPAEANTKNQQ